MNFIIQKLKSKHTSLKTFTNLAKLIYFSLVLREREEKTHKYFAPKPLFTTNGLIAVVGPEKHNYQKYMN